MANNIIEIHVNTNDHLVSPGQAIIKGDNLQFDTVTERWYFGSGGVTAGYEPGGAKAPKGNNAAGNLTGTWVCMGYSDVERLPGGPMIATITWRGLLSTAGNTSMVETTSIRETTYELLGGLPGAGATSKPARVHDIVYGLQCRGIFGVEQKAPVIQNGTGLTGQQGGFTIPSAAPPQVTVFGGAETWNYPYGWLPYSWQQEEPVKGLFLVTAEFRYVHQKTFG